MCSWRLTLSAAACKVIGEMVAAAVVCSVVPPTPAVRVPLTVPRDWELPEPPVTEMAKDSVLA